MNLESKRLLNLIFKAVVGFFLLFFLYETTSFLLVDFPFNMYEPEVIMDSWAVSQGQYLYPLRTVGPIAGLYAPLYNIVIAFFFQFLPNTLLTARLISVLSLLFAVGMIFKSIKNLPFAGILSIFAIFMWHPALLNFDMHAKPDSFSVMLGMASTFVLISKRSIKTILLAAFLSALALAAKQSMAFVPVGIGLALLIQKDWKNVFLFGVSFLVLTGALWFVLFKTMGPDMWFYVFVQPGTFKMYWAGTIINFWYIQYTLIWLAVLVLFPVLMYQKQLTWDIILVFSVTILAMPACVLTASKGGGMVNAYQAFFYFSSWLALLMIDKQWKSGLNIQNRVVKNEYLTQWILILVLFFTVKPNFPSIILSIPQRLETHKQYSALINDIQKDGGTIYAPMDNYVSLKAGKPIRWSYKWQIETPLTKDNNPGKNHVNLALASDLVVTVHNADWTSDTKLEVILQQNGYSKLHSYPLTLSQTYFLWKKSN
jgi:hypothetical protein